MSTNLTRRDLVKLGGAVGAGALAASATTALADEAPAADESGIEWAQEADVVILGTGAGGLSAAITAAEAGCSVLVFEKANEEDQGGNTRVSGKMWTCPTDVETGLQYYLAASERTRDDEYLTALATSANTLNDDFISKLPGASIDFFPLFSPEFAALPGGEAIQAYQNTGGSNIWDCLHDGALQYPDLIQFSYHTPGVRLITNPDGEVIGVVVQTDDGEINVKAKKGVIVATGGYEHNEDLIENSYPGWPIYSRGTPYNDGSGILMCQKVGAALWHMNASDSGCGAMLCPGLDYGHGDYDSDTVPANMAITQASESLQGFIDVNKHGKRFMPEDRADGHGYGRREYLFFYDGVECEWPQLPFWTLFDEETAQSKQAASGYTGLGGFTWFSAHSGYEWSADNSAEVEKGWILKADTLEELAEQMNGVEGGEGKMDAATLQATVDNWNAMCEAGEDTEFGRAPETMRPLTGPFYAILTYPTQYNTQGGPKRNTNAQTLDAFGEPIPRLYNVGECGAGYGWVYNGGWNNCEAMVTGRWAGAHVATLEAWA